MPDRQTRIGEHFAGSSRQSRSQAQVRYAESSPESRSPSPGDSEGSEGLATIRLTQRSSPVKQTLTQKRNKRIYALSSDEDMEVVDEQVPVALSSTRPVIPSIPMEEESSDDEPVPVPRPKSRKTGPVIEINSRKQPALPPFYSSSDSLQRPKRSTRSTQSPQKPTSEPVSSTLSSANSQRRLTPVVEIPRSPQEQLATYTIMPPPSDKDVSFAPVLETPAPRALLSVSPDPDKPMEEAPIPQPVVPEAEEGVSSDEPILRPSARKGKARAIPRTYPPIPSRTPSPIIPTVVISSDSSDEEIIRRKRLSRPLPKNSSNSHRKEKSQIARPVKEKSRTPHKPTPRHRDPDENDGAVTDEDDVDDLKLDEPERFKTKTRLRKKTETDFQRRLRKLKQLRAGIVEDSTDESESEEEPIPRSAAQNKDFIVEDDGELADGIMPHEFSINSAQTPEFKFKVVFHWLLLLVMDEQSALHLRPDDKEYFMPQVEDLRRKMQGYRESRVRSQIWRASLTRRLQKYPIFTSSHMGESEIGCDVCRVSTKRSPYLGYFSGDPYNPKTHELIKVESSGSESDNFAQRGDKRYYLMGRHCRRRAEIYHRMVHYEHVLYIQIRDYYRDLLRAKNVAFSSDSDLSSEESDPDESDNARTDRRQERENRRYRTLRRVKELKEMQLTKVDWKSVDKVLMWMDRDMEYQAKEFRQLESLIEQSELLENDKSKDE